MNQSEGVRFACEAPRTGWNGTKGQKRVENQLTWQNRPTPCHPVPPLPAAREGRGSLELVEIFQIAICFFEKRRSVEVNVAPAGRTAVPAPGGSYGAWDHSPCVWFCLCMPIETSLPTGTWDQRRRARSPGWAVSLPLGALAREGCGSLGLVEIFQMRIAPRTRRSVVVDVTRAGSRRREVRTGLGTTPLVCGFACAGQ